VKVATNVGEPNKGHGCFGAPPVSITTRHGETEMDYDNTNRGVLFSERDKKTKDDDRDYGGSINIDGAEYWLSAWIKTSKKTGQKFMSLSIKPKQATPVAAKKPLAEDLNDQIGF
jgi:hypothetical protein